MLFHNGKNTVAKSKRQRSPFYPLIGGLLVVGWGWHL